MKIEGKYKFDATQQEVWEIFTDPRYLEKTLPGCERLEETEPGKYDAYLKIGIAAVKGTYTGKFELADTDPPKKYRLIGEEWQTQEIEVPLADTRSRSCWSRRSCRCRAD